ncbi:hypothetical protein Tco_1232630, partial [Tanacetum coccineum]
VTNMPQAIVGYTPLTKSYIPKVSEIPEFERTLQIPYNGQAVFTNEWDLTSLSIFQDSEGPYHIELPTPDEIRRILQFQRIELNCTIKSKNVILTPNQILTKELRQDMKRWEELICEIAFGLGGHRDHLPACLAHMLYCIVAEEQYNLAYFFAKRIESARAASNANLHYGSGYHQKDRKPSQNDKTEHGMEKTVKNKGQKSKNAKVRVNINESAVKPEPELKNTIGCNLNPSDGPGKPNSI